MKRILFRGGMSPLESFDTEKILFENVIGTNVGNFLYVYGVLNALCEDDSVLRPNYYRYAFDAKEVNNNYDCFLIPLADAFRPSFMGTLRKLTKLVKSLDIPCVVTGVGLNVSLDSDPTKGYEFDNDVKAFMDAVLEKSSCVGIRGKITGEYLKSLGYVENKDFMVIGCPSMYSFGNRLKIRDTHIDSNSRVAINSNPTSPNEAQLFIKNNIDKFDNSMFVGQVTSELKLLYMGAPYNGINQNYPLKTIEDKMYSENRSIFFTNIPQWLDYYKNVDFAFGTRLHGNIAACLAGTPSILIAKDTRTKELAEFHKLTYVLADEVKADTDIFDLIENADFHSIETVQEKNLKNFIKFLDLNNLKHIYSDGDFSKETPLERKMREVKTVPPVVPMGALSDEEKAARLKKYFAYENSERSKLKTENAELRKLLGSKPINYAVKLRNSIKKDKYAELIDSNKPSSIG